MHFTNNILFKNLFYNYYIFIYQNIYLTNFKVLNIYIRIKNYIKEDKVIFKAFI